MSEQEQIDSDELVSIVCSKSIDIQDLIENNDPNALQEFQTFYDQAIQALDLQIEKVSALDMESSNYFDIFNDATKELKTLRDKVFALTKDKKQQNETLDILQKENDVLEKEYLELLNKNDSTDYKSMIEEVQKQIDELQNKEQDVDKQLAENSGKTTDMENEIPSLKKQIDDTEDGLAVKIKKNQRRAKEIEARLKKLETQPITASNPKEKVFDEEEDTAGPSTIIHRTTGTVQDQIRELKTDLEEALKLNGSLKTNMKGLSQDLDAMREENFQLKELLRSIQKDKKK
ncbi:hypothetical protein TVAG_426410 [Trichomonas vaginalis G3]|uniref:Uncharacterized protein n=1 Tax=Trichomonas vaginalis (strain ATCC PRA-98 / G3) TaxID=412133 RepID=A2DYQ8_TRIV3|nr:hypothetical protein TVAGG3_0850400 [Trichomonas vaginalis G3]EAY14448.1 hypothetical protein TVAG_426410 [Trichomonas vaginalis G3]KAI5499939.1 hypothetical protein TVAGG3_0850400 [Trichomonas vaginalis G3]|eukprot:XP_001326671.1 hypothetical protein [Trichomonas vaginalis G3]